MIIPLGVDVPMERRPFVNWLMVGGMTALFFWQIFQPREVNEALCLNGFFSRGLFTHMWIHAGLMHLIGNMLFLWVVGNAVCYKVGNLVYLPIFFVLGVAAALAYSIYCSGPMLGASGAINGIIGMSLVFFPVNDITCLWILFPFCILYPRPPCIFKFSLSGYWMILFWLAFDVYGAMHGQGMVAYWAHLGGFFGGVGLAMLLLKVKYVRMTRFESSLLDIIYRRGNPPAATASLQYADYLDEQAQKNENEYDAPKMPLYPQGGSDESGFIRFTCACGKSIKTSVKNSGRTGKCPKCKNTIKIPRP
jgi:membrane associated rhomboid family serine protease